MRARRSPALDSSTVPISVMIPVNMAPSPPGLRPHLAARPARARQTRLRMPDGGATHRRILVGNAKGRSRALRPAWEPRNLGARTRRQAWRPDPTDGFLFLQGPHGPFFRHCPAHAPRHRRRSRCAWASTRAIRRSGPTGDSYIALYRQRRHWPAARIPHPGRPRRITDLVLYGDTRPIHAPPSPIAGPAASPCTSSRRVTSAPTG
jgi:hypothetical protein